MCACETPDQWLSSNFYSTHIHFLTPFSNNCMLSCLSNVWLFPTLWTIAHRFLCLWDSPGQNTGVGCQDLLQEIPLHSLQWQAGSLPRATGKPLPIIRVGLFCLFVLLFRAKVTITQKNKRNTVKVTDILIFSQV